MRNNIIAGLISGATVTVFVVLTRIFWTRVVVPWFEERVYKDVRIEGKWFALYPLTREKRQETVVLKRQGHAVQGTMICTVGHDEGEQYDLSGSFRNLILPLIYESSDTSKTDRGTITLKLVRNAERFQGKVAAYNSEVDVIGDIDVIWFRKKEALDSHLERMDKMDKEIEEARKQEKQAEAAKQKVAAVPQKEAVKPSNTPKETEETSVEKTDTEGKAEGVSL